MHESMVKLNSFVCSHFGFKPMAGAEGAPQPAPDGVLVAVPSSKPAQEKTRRKSLWEQSCDTAHENTKTSNRVLKRKTTEEIVDKSLYDNFRTFTASEIDGVVVDGMTLRQRLQADKAKQKLDPKMITTGQRYCAMLRNTYASTEHAQQRLKVVDPSLSVNPVLMKAMVLNQNKSQNNRGAIIGWMGTATSVNQTEPKTLKKSSPIQEFIT